MRKPIPAYVDEMVEGAVSRLNNLKTEHTFAFAFMTDTHNCMDLTERSLYAVGKIHEEYPLLFNCLGGDYLCNNVNTTKQMAVDQHKELSAAIDELGQTLPTMVVKGNHDDNPFGPLEVCITRDELYDILMKHNSRFTGDPEEPKAMYGYYDMPQEKLRAIYLDAVDREYVTDETGIVVDRSEMHFGNRQINWFAHEALKLPEKDWSVVVFAHMQAIPSRVTMGRMFGGNAIWNILSAFKHGESYASSEKKHGLEYSVECDFTEQGEGDVIAFICGHNHADRTAISEGIRMISCCATASDNFTFTVPGMEDKTIPRKTRGSGEESAFTVFVVNRETRRISVIRCGAGPDYHVEY